MVTGMATTRPTAASVRSDLLDEQAALDAIVTDLTTEQWALPTASPRWSVADQIAHLAYFDESASWAIADEDRFRASLDDLAPALDPNAGPEAVDDLTLGAFRDGTRRTHRRMADQPAAARRCLGRIGR